MGIDRFHRHVRSFVFLLALMLFMLCPAPARAQSADLNGDGKVNNADLSILMSQFGKAVAPTHDSRLTTPAPLAAHPSQSIIDGPCYFIEITQGRFVHKESGGRFGYAWPHGQRVFDRGWCSLLPDVQAAVKAGYTSVWLWEPAGQYEGIGGCMAWLSERTGRDSWSDAMLDDFDDFCRIAEELGAKVIVYNGCANALNVGTTLIPNQRRSTLKADQSMFVADLAWLARQGVDGVGLDGWALLQDEFPALSIELLAAVRKDRDAAKLVLICEGWPSPGAAKLQAQTQAQCASLELIRGGHNAVSPGWDEFAKRINVGEELARVPGRVGILLLHGGGNAWTEAQLNAAYDHCVRLNMTPMDWRLDGPARLAAARARLASN